jgi:thiamine-phosphate pyrophosphorylase
VSAQDIGTVRRARLSSARLYLVCGASPAAGELSDVLAAAIAGGVDVFQLREKHLGDAQLLDVAREAQAICERLGVLFILNDRPDLAREAGADGVHVGQEDMGVAEARALLGADVLLGLSTHAPAEIDAVDVSLVDYIGVGPVHATPTKLGRAAVGLELVSYAASHARLPFFAIGGLDVGNVSEALDAGASRVCVLRAIAGDDDPERGARSLRDLLERRAAA